MAANVQWLFYRNTDNGIIVKILHNEKEAALPVNSPIKPYYKWDDVKSFYENKLKQF